MIRRVVAVLLLCAMTVGCAAIRAHKMPRFDVEATFLDFANITYHEANSGVEEEPPLLTRVALSGSGHLHYARGRSQRVTESFWTDASRKHWNDIRTDQIVLGKGQTNTFLQRLVNAGIFDHDMQGEQVENPAHDFVSVQARIDGKQGFTITDARIYVSIFKDLVAQLER